MKKLIISTFIIGLSTTAFAGNDNILDSAAFNEGSDMNYITSQSTGGFYDFLSSAEFNEGEVISINNSTETTGVAPQVGDYTTGLELPGFN